MGHATAGRSRKHSAGWADFWSPTPFFSAEISFLRVGADVGEVLVGVGLHRLARRVQLGGGGVQRGEEIPAMAKGCNTCEDSTILISIVVQL